LATMAALCSFTIVQGSDCRCGRTLAFFQRRSTQVGSRTMRSGL
jgi:hypothetical protein